MEEEIVFVVMSLVECARVFGRLPAYRYHVTCKHIHLAGVNRCKEIGNTEESVTRLAGKREANRLFQHRRMKRGGWNPPIGSRRRLVDNEIVSVRLTREVAVDDLRNQKLFPSRLLLQSQE